MVRTGHTVIRGIRGPQPFSRFRTFAPERNVAGMDSLSVRGKVLIVAAGVLLTGTVAAISATRDPGPLSHRAAYDRVEAEYQYVYDRDARQAHAIPAQMTALVHRFATRLQGVEVQPDERAEWDAVVSAARAEAETLCAFPASRADELSTIDDLDQYCGLPRPDHLSSARPFSAVLRAGDRLAAAVEALPVR